MISLQDTWLLHKNSNLRKIILLLLLVVILEGVFLSKNARTSNTSESYGPTDISGAKSFWHEKINSLGSAKAYEQFKQDYKAQNFMTQHSLAHVFGQLLYKKDGINGITVCDSDFSFGCFHSFFSLALATEGDGILTKLNDACIGRYGEYGTGCQHGIGHGLMEYFGPKKLSDALSRCSPIQKFLLLGCSSGVFMEYNNPVLISDTETVVERRSLNDKNPYKPCGDVEERFQPSCYFEQSSWWYEVYNGDMTKLDSLCSELTYANREACFKGIGSAITPKLNFETKDSVDLCKKIKRDQDQTYCISGISWSLFADPKYRDKSADACNSSSNPSLCIEYSKLIDESLN